MLSLSSISKRKMGNYSQYKTTADLTNGPSGTNPHYHLFSNLSTDYGDASCTQNSTLDGDTTTSG
jgi:hypothetical protein